MQKLDGPGARETRSEFGGICGDFDVVRTETGVSEHARRGIGTENVSIRAFVELIHNQDQNPNICGRFVVLTRTLLAALLTLR